MSSRIAQVFPSTAVIADEPKSAAASISRRKPQVMLVHTGPGRRWLNIPYPG
jgi:hypothetical protein